MSIRIWSGFHDPQLKELVAAAWDHGELLVLCPPRLRDLSFLDFLPPGALQPCGSWNADDRNALLRNRNVRKDFPEPPILGVFTSGTLSGTPRLVLYSQSNLRASLSGVLEFFDAARIEAIFCYPQPFHTFGLVLGYLLAVVQGVPLYAASGPYGRAAHTAWIAATQTGLLTLGTPTHFHDLIETIRASEHVCHPSYSAIIGGAPVSIRLWEDSRSVLKINAPSIGYGCTEASPGLMHLAPGIAPEEEGEVGVPLSNVSIQLHPGRGLEFTGPGTCMAMVEDGSLVFPKAVLIADDVEPCHDGRFIFRGRIGLTLNRGGEKFALEHLETLIASRTEIEVICLAVPSERLGDDLAVVVAASVEHFERVRAVIAEEFRIALRHEHFVAVEMLPVTSNGKRDRQAAYAMVSRSMNSTG